MYVFAIIYGLGNGMFWCGIHTYELSQIQITKRDFYSSGVEMGKDIFYFLIPFLISFIFFISDKFSFTNGYSILFLIFIIIFLLSLIFLKSIPDYEPKSVSILEIIKKFNKKEIFQNLFFIFDEFPKTIIGILIAIITIKLFETEINIGIFEGLAGLISIMITVFLSTKRGPDNRLKIMFIFSLLIFVNLILLGFNLTIFGLIIYKLFDYILSPGRNISGKVFIMKYMGDLKKDHDMFLTKVIYRELVLTIGRVITIGLLYFAYNYLISDIFVLAKITLIIFGFALLMSYFFCIYGREKKYLIITFHIFILSHSSLSHK